jgi:ATP/maltotriose-dependent transcriptional regulator MalT
LYIQYSRLIALSTLCLVLLFSDSGLQHSTSQIRSHTCSTLCVSSANSPSLPANHCPHSAVSHALTHRDMTVPHLIVRWPYMLLIHRHRPSLLFQLVPDIPFSYLLAAWMSEATWVTIILCAVALCCNIFL